MPDALIINGTTSLENLAEIKGKVLLAAADSGLGKKKLDDLELALEEAIVNVCKYANTGPEGKLEVIVDSNQKDSLSIQIIDSGIAFNPLDMPEPDLEVDIAERQIGGLGVFLIKKLMDEVKYRRVDSKNILELVINL